jgi:hypothetical protein
LSISLLINLSTDNNNEDDKELREQQDEDEDQLEEEQDEQDGEITLETTNQVF